MGNNKLDPYKEDIISLYKDGKNTYEIARMFNVNHVTIYRLLKKEGIELRKAGSNNKKELPIKDIISLYKDGKNTYEIADMFSISRTTISRLLKKQGIEIRKRGGGRKKIELPIKDIISLYKDGKSTIEIGKIFSVNHVTIYKLLKKEGIELRKRGGHNKIELPIEDIISLYKDGKNTVEISKIFNVNYSTIYTLLKKEGIEIRKRSGRKKSVN